MKQLLEKIRAQCNHPWKRALLFQDKILWNKLWTSIDTMEDTQLAIESYESLPEFTAYENGYLFIYGLMQALNIQQDAINNLSVALFNNTINYKKDYPKLYEIREHRNNSIGHPTKRGSDDSFHIIDRSSISKKFFTLGSYYPKSGKQTSFQEINVIDCIETQTKLSIQILEQTMRKLENDFKEHKNKFQGQKLISYVPNDFQHQFSKLYQNVDFDYPLAEMNFNSIKSSYEKIKKGIVERYFSLSALQGVDYTSGIIDYILVRLHKDLIKEKISDKKELYIFIDALDSNFEDLREMLVEIDKEFDE